VSDADELHFEWDEAKALSNLAKHGVSFQAATFVFDDSDRLEEDDVFAQGEYRTIVVGAVDGIVLTVVYSEPEENLIRIISARQAEPHERKAYEQNILHP
jgi:uncharacterized DUF497 family protein